MGNLLTYQFALASALHHLSVQSSLAADMQQRAQAFLASELGAGRGIIDFSLTGAGDGHSFLTTIVTGTALEVILDPQLMFYVASNAITLDAAAASALAALAEDGRVIHGWAEAGSCDGHRWMGMILHGAALG